MFWDLSWNDRLIVSQAIGAATGILMVLLFLLLLIRAPRQAINLRHFALLIFCGLSWNGTGIALAALGHTRGEIPIRFVAAFSILSAGLLPAGLVILWRARLPESWLSSKWVLRVTVLISAILSPLCLFSIYGIFRWTEFAPGDWMSVHIAITAVLGAVAFLTAPNRTAASTVYSLATAGGAILLALSAPLLHSLPPTPENRFWAMLCKQDGGLLMVIGCFFLFGTFRFAQVFVRQGLRILIIAVSAPALWALLSTVHAGGAQGFLIASGALAVVLLATPLLDRGIALFVDEYLLRRPDYQSVLRRTWEAINPLDSEDEILSVVSQQVNATLGLESCRILRASDVGALGATMAEGEIRELCAGEGDIDVLVPVRRGKDVCYAMALRQQSRHTELLASEVQFLLTMASQLGSRLEGLQFERERMERQHRETRLHSELIQAELRALRAQINPHFLFNSLNAIADLIVVDPPRAEEMTVRLAKVFRYVLRHSDCQVASVADEMEFLRSYLGIEEARFGGRLRVTFDVEQSVQPDCIPTLLLQPLVENAIKHGLAPKVGPGTLSISARRDGSYLRLAVEDDGMGPPAPPVVESFKASTGLGLRNVTDRLKTLYNGRANLSFEGVPRQGSRVTILIPLET
ncbi:MAG: histidine kinase [Acidobacteria bacterium]|nr:histidine kinase [Acidobacteriota bacterium]